MKRYSVAFDINTQLYGVLDEDRDVVVFKHQNFNLVRNTAHNMNERQTKIEEAALAGDFDDKE